MSDTNRLVARLRTLRASGRRGLAPFVTAGDGGLDVTLSVLRALDKAGAVCVELGLPFSDPIADGPILQEAAQRALGAGTTFDDILEMVLKFRRGSDGFIGSILPLAIMSYANPLVRRGWNPALKAIAKAGADAVLVADLPVEEGAPLISAARASHIAPIFFVAPTTSDQRLDSAIAHSQGFVYAIGRFGVTGKATELDEAAQAFLARVREHARDLPVAVGFGITTAAEVAAAVEHADIAIVGSALVERVHRGVRAAPAALRVAAAATAAGEFLEDLSRGLPS